MKAICLTIACMFLLAPTGVFALCSCAMQGDIDGSSAVDISDLTGLVDYFFRSGPVPVDDADCVSINRAELNCDFSVDISDLTYFVDYLFKGGLAPCDPCTQIVLPPPDGLTSEQYLFLDTNLHNMIYETGSSAFFYLNGAGVTTYDTVLSTSNDGDTLYENISHRHNHDSAVVLQIVASPIPYNYPPREEWSDHYMWQSPGRTAWAQFPLDEVTENGVPQPNSALRIEGNQIIFLGETYNIDNYFDYGPPSLAADIANGLNNHPPMVTPDQIPTGCSEGTINLANFRIISLLEIISSSTTSSGITYETITVFDILMTHSWIWECPDGPQRRVVFFEFRVSFDLYIDGVLTDSYSAGGKYYRTYDS